MSDSRQEVLIAELRFFDSIRGKQETFVETLMNKSVFLFFQNIALDPLGARATKIEYGEKFRDKVGQYFDGLSPREKNALIHFRKTVLLSNSVLMIWKGNIDD